VPGDSIEVLVAGRLATRDAVCVLVFETVGDEPLRDQCFSGVTFVGNLLLCFREEDSARNNVEDEVSEPFGVVLGLTSSPR
jgi:hypothetical protein